jgi:hypothetical protein
MSTHTIIANLMAMLHSQDNVPRWGVAICSLLELGYFDLNKE